MKYLYMIYLDEAAMAALPSDELEVVQTAAGAHVEELQATGRLLPPRHSNPSSPPRPSASATGSCP